MADINEKLPKYMQVAEYFKEIINSKKVEYGEKLPSESEIMEQFKVSRHTVRQALMNLERDGYVYKEHGRGSFCCFRENRSDENKKTIAVITTYISNYIFPHIIRGVEEVLSLAGYMLTLFNTNNEKQKEQEYLQKVIQDDNVVGLIIEPTMSALENTNFYLYKELETKGIPYIMINAKYDDLDPAYVIMDDVEGGKVITDYLLQLGHKQIAGIFKTDDKQGVNRLLGYKKALAQYGVNINNEYIAEFSTTQEDFIPYEFANNLLRKENRPSAIVCYNDQAAIQVLHAIRDIGLRVPEDISIVGYDNSDMATATEVKLTTIRHPKDELGKRAARFLINMIENKENKLS